ncbi:hypothetical protein DFH08DRAFT_946207 [Mycena albidolilacea]|uniref:Uncharacterized protein n=1 Tax=Mycena albidolilacea TaxID=1033008 RepID=A0AAD7E7P6_9AGAR|nr:hypothetical protein DFH08DRAFT_946207 [Mycena albidolilacea]
MNTRWSPFAHSHRTTASYALISASGGAKIGCGACREFRIIGPLRSFAAKRASNVHVADSYSIAKGDMWCINVSSETLSVTPELRHPTDLRLNSASESSGSARASFLAASTSPVRNAIQHCRNFLVLPIRIQPGYISPPPQSPLLPASCCQILYRPVFLSTACLQSTYYTPFFACPSRSSPLTSLAAALSAMVLPDPAIPIVTLVAGVGPSGGRVRHQRERDTLGFSLASQAARLSVSAAALQRHN